MAKERTSYLRAPEPSDSEYGAYGHTNYFGGFHKNTDLFAYVGLFALLFTHPRGFRFIRRMIWWRWVHRSCDTVDFHHFACPKDSFTKILEDRDRWHRVWTDKNAHH